MADASFSEGRNLERPERPEYPEDVKKLRKREKRLLERLDEAYIAQKNAAERFQRAEARLLKRLARTQRLEARLATLRQQLETFTSPNVTVTALDATTTSGPMDPLTDHAVQEENTASEHESAEMAKAREARSVAIAAEQAARLAVERALRIAARLENMAAGRHLSQELLDLEAQAAQASAAALDAELAAQEAERLASASPINVTLPSGIVDDSIEDSPSQDSSTTEAPVDKGIGNTNASEMPTQDEEILTSEATKNPDDNTTIRDNIPETTTSEAATSSTPPEISTNTAVSDTNTSETLSEETVSDGASVTDMTGVTGEVDDEPDAGLHTGLPTPVEQERVEEIEEDEERVAMVAAMMIADAAGANAAKAEALAEEASARTAKARRLTQEADVLLERIREAIRNGASSGDAAEAILFDAERDATHAHATLADAEAAEERARRAAMEAEAEAEVAEGMAFAAGDRSEDDEIRREEDPQTSTLLEGQQHTSDTGEIERLAQRSTTKPLEDEDTIEVPIVRPM